MKYSNTVEYNISTKLDSSGLTKLQSQIKQLENSMQQMANRELLNSDKVQAAKTQLEGLNTALTNSFNSSLGILDLSKFRAELDAGGVSAKRLQSAFSMMGAEGQAALNSLTTQIANFNGGMERTSSAVDKIFTTFSNTFRWGMVSSFFSQFMNAIHSSIDYVKELDDSLTQIMLVTDYNKDSMNEFAKSANEAAKAVSMTTTGMTNASLIFAQQGYDLGQSQELATLSAKVANASQQDTATTSDQITAYMNAYGLENSISELTQAMDNWALIANISAADVGELAQASQRAASMANAVGVSGEQLASQIATIESVTREAPEQIGNGLKTLYARFSDIASGKEDEDGFTLGKVTSELNKIGVQVLDEMGQIRDVGDIMEDLMVIWDDLDQTSKVAASQALAGKYQVNRFMALMDNSDMYEEYKGATGANAAGTLDMMNEEYAQSIEGRSAKLQASLEGLFSTIFNTDDIYPWMDAAQGAVDLLQQFFDALGGGKTILLGISTLLGQVFNQNIARSINDTIANRNLGKIRENNINSVGDTLDRVGIDKTQGIGAYITATAQQSKLGALSDAQYDAYMNNVKNWADASTALAQSEEQLTDTINLTNAVFEKISPGTAAVTKGEFGALNTIEAKQVSLTDDAVKQNLHQVDFSEESENARQVALALRDVQTETNKTKISQEDLGNAIYHVQDRLDDLGKIYNQDQSQELRNNLEKIKEDISQTGEISESAKKQIQQYITEMEHLSESLANLDETDAKRIITDRGNAAEKAFTTKQFNQTQVDRAEENALTGQQGIDKQLDIKNILDTFNAVQQLTFAWQAFQNLGSLWANEDLSTGEKVLQTIMNLTMAMPQLITAMQTLQENSFLQNVGNNLLNAFNSSNNFGDISILFDQLNGQSNQIAAIQNQVVGAQAAMGAPLEEALLQVKLGSDEIMELQRTADIGAQALQTLDDAASGVVDGGLVKLVEEGQKAQKQLDELEKTVGKALEEGLVEAPKILDDSAKALNKVGTESEKTQAQLGQMPNVFVEMYAASLAAGGGITGFKAALDVAKTSMLEFLSVSGPFLAIGLAIGAIAFAIGQAQEQAKEAHDQAIADFEEAKNAQQQVADLSTKIDDWKSKRQSTGDNKELIDEAKTLADEFRALGKETEATNIALAAARAEAQNTAEGYNALEEALTNTQKAVKEDSYLDAMNKAQEVLENQLSTIEEINAAKELMLDSGGQLGMQRLADTEGQKMHVFDAQDEATRRAGTEALTEATASWESIDSYLKEVAPGYSEIADEAERLAKAHQWATTEAQKAVITTRELLLANQNLTERGGAYDSRNDYVTAGREGILDQLRNAGFTAEEQLKIIASFDDDATDKEITEGIAKIQEQLKTNPDLTLAIRAALDEDNIKQSVEKQLESYQPKDADVAQEDFQRLTNTFYENKDKMGEEGTPFEDLSETLFTNAEALERLVEGILRYNDAITSIDENYDKWNEALEDNNIFSDEYQDTLDDLQDTYADFLDLSEDLSDEFLSNRKNLQKLKDASEGVEGAYEDLEDAAKADIYMNVTGIDNIDVAEEKIKEISNLLSDPEFEAIDVGEAFDIHSLPELEESINNFLLNFKGSAEEAVAAVHDLYGVDIPVNNIVEAGNDAVNAVDSIQNTSQDAVSVVGEMAQGVTDAAQTAAAGLAEGLTGSTEVELNGTTATANDTVQYTNLTPQPGPEIPITSYMPVGNGNTGVGSGVTMEPFVAHVRGVTYTAESVPVPETKEMTGQQIKSEYKPGSTNGGFTLKPGAMGTKAAPSSAKRSGGARPSSSGGGGGGGKSCFIAGTLVSTSFGYKPIELIRPDDFVLSYNELLCQNEYSKVIQTMIHDTIEPIYILYIKNERLKVTGIHRFLISKNINFEPQWVAAQDLQIGDWVLLADNTWHLIWKIEVNLEHQIVYNFEVAGNHNYYVGRNQILAHNKGGSGKKGSGSGSGQKAKTAKKKEAEKTEKKYYEEVDKQLEQTEKTLKSLEKATDKLTGTQARAKQNEQLKLLQKEKDLQEKKLKILQEQEKVDVSSTIKKADKDFEDLLKKQGVNFNLLDFTFDEEGFINNLDSVRESITNGINKLNDQYNAIIGDDGEVTDEEQERLKALDEEIKKLEKLGKEVEKNGTRYNEIVIEEQEIQDQMQEIQDQIQDIAIDAYKASQEAIDDLKDLRKEWAKFSAGLYDSSKGESFLSLDNPIRQLKEIENEISSIYAVSGTEARKYYDDIIAQQQKYLENAKTADEQQAYKDAIEYYEKLRDSIDDGAVLNNGLMQLALNDLTRLQEIWNNWNDEGGNGFFGDDKAALEKALEDAQKRVMEFAQDFEELIEDLKNASLDVVDHTMEQWDRQLDRYDRVIDQLDRYSDTYSLIYGDASYDMQEAVLSQQAQTLKSELDAAQEAYLAANTYYLEAYEKFVDKSTGLAKEGYEDYMYELEEAMNDAEDKVRDIAADAAEKFSEAFEAAVMASTQYILRNTIGENDFEHSDRNWEWDKEYIDKYKDGVEKAYEMDKLRNRYIDMLNNAQGASLQTQNKIRAQMQEQLDLLDGQKTVSEYDVKLANAKLEILQKQIALEDAQRNKNKMQLRRDTQGNYRYVYTADKDNVDQAQQELLDSEYDAYEMSKQQQMNNYDDMINAYKRYLSQREEILTNNNLSEAQKMEQIKELWDRFQKYVNAAQEDFGDATAGTVDILQWLVVNGTDYTATAATDMLNQLLDAEGNVAEQSGVIWMDLANNMANEVIPSIANAVTTADDVIEQKLVQTGIALVGEDGTGGVFGEVSNGANDFGDQCEMAANQTAILAEQSNKLKEALLGDSDAFVETQGKLASYQKQLEDVAEASSNTARALRDTQTALDKANAEKLNYKTQIDRLLSGQDIIVDHKIVDAEEYRRQQEEEKRKQQQRNSGGGGGRNALADARAIWYHGAWGNGGDWYTPYSRQFGTAAANKVLWYFNHGYGYNFDFDTGGYTGEWNQGEGVSSHKNGKLAFLHQKELILNAQDTENILSAVSMVRSLANSAQASMNNINTAASSNINSIYNPVTEQRVDIQASFPNATDAEDIRQALIGLSDRAYQYAHRVI